MTCPRCGKPHPVVVPADWVCVTITKELVTLLRSNNIHRNDRGLETAMKGQKHGPSCTCASCKKTYGKGGK